MKLADNIYAVGGGSLGYALSDRHDCNVYALKQKEGVILIDAGSGMGEEALLHNLRKDGLKADRIITLLLTHAHADHAGGASGLKSRLGIRVYASGRTASIVESGDEDRLSLRQARKGGIYPEWYRFKPCGIDRILKDGDTIRHGSFQLQIIAVPGHSRDMIGFYELTTKSLFSGDAVFEGGKLAVIATDDFSMEEYRHTVERLSQLDVDRLFPGHGAAVLKNGKTPLLLAADRFKRGVPPESIV